ncbi:cardiolipin synthase [Nocardioides ungokensis]|uniref:cardiolipin synthase n=1 Tax=Nocardioides ungokensis TaxID=1643322 RepID=UPI0015DF0AA7|nr:cardiolipin synthase [Nocardioides ungokensis]
MILSILATLATVLVVAAVVGVVVALLTDDRDPSVLLAWLFVIVLIPVLGVVAYFFVGRNQRKETHQRGQQRSRLHQMDQRDLAPVLAASRDFSKAAVAALDGTPGQRVESAGHREGGSVPVPADSVRLYFAGADKFRDLLADLRGARERIDLMYLIWEKDELTAEVTGILLDRIHAGVRVHILFDWLSSLPYKKDELEQLARAGAVVAPCYKRPRQLNYRNHMKMAFVDNAVVYSGGMNMGQEYIDGGKRFETWRDTHFRMTGPVVAVYLRLFADTWLLNGREEDVFPAGGELLVDHPVDEGVPVQVLHSSVSTAFPTIRDVFVVALTNARDRVWIQSPYFIPDEPLLTAMCVAASSGVDVRFMMTGHPDKKVPFNAAHAYFGTILRAGVRVFTYDAGFLHSKTVTMDEHLAIIGTCNWDIRSLILHDEVVSVFYDQGVARTCGEQYERDLAHCSEVTLADLAALSRWATLRNSLCRLFSRLL